MISNHSELLNVRNDFRRAFGDRKDGRRINNASPDLLLLPVMKPKRSESQIEYRCHIDIGNAEEWIRNNTRQNTLEPDISHIIAAAFVRACSFCPEINRFICGKKLFARNGIQVVLQDPRSGSENFIKVPLHLSDKLSQISRKISDKQEKIKASYGTNYQSNLLTVAVKFPRFLLRFAFGILRVMDFCNLLPKLLLKSSPYHASVLICRPQGKTKYSVSVPLNNYGSISVCMSYSIPFTEYATDENGCVFAKRCIDCSVVVDERIADRESIVKALQCWEFFIANPGQLDISPKRFLDDIM